MIEAIEVQVNHLTYSNETNQITRSEALWKGPELNLYAVAASNSALTPEENQRRNELNNLKSTNAQLFEYIKRQKTFSQGTVQNIQSILDQLGEQLRYLKDEKDSYQSENERLQSENERLQSENERLQTFADQLGLLGEEKSKDFADIIAADETVKLARNQASEFRQQAIQSAESAEQAAFASREAVQAQEAAFAAKNAAKIVEEAADTLKLIKLRALTLLLDKSNDPVAEAQTIEELRQQAETAKQEAETARDQAETAAANAERFARQTTQDYNNWDAIRTIFHLSEPISEPADTVDPASSDSEPDNMDSVGIVDNWDAIQDIFGISSRASMRP